MGQKLGQFFNIQIFPLRAKDIRRINRCKRFQERLNYVQRIPLWRVRQFRIRYIEYKRSFANRKVCGEVKSL